MKIRTLVIVCWLALATSAAFAQEGAVPKDVPTLNHVWVIMMENHGFSQVLNTQPRRLPPSTLTPRTSPLTISQWPIPA